MLFNHADMNHYDGIHHEHGIHGHEAAGEQPLGFDDLGHNYAPGHPISPVPFDHSPHLIESNGGYDLYGAHGNFVRHFETDQVFGQHGELLHQFDHFNIYSDHGHFIHRGDESVTGHSSLDSNLYGQGVDYHGSGPLLHHDDPLAHMNEYRMPPLVW